MVLSEQLALLFLILLIQTGIDGSVMVKRNNEGVNNSGSLDFEKSLFGGSEERNLEQEIMQEINHLSARKQREIFNDLEKQHEKFNTTKSLVLSETQSLSPLNVEELKNIRKTIKTSNSSLPAIRNKRTLNFLLFVVARAMGYTLTPTNPDAEWIPRQQPSAQPSASPPPSPPCMPNPPPSPPCMPNPPPSPPCMPNPPPSPPCMPNPPPSPPCMPPPSTPPPRAMPPTNPPCPGSALAQPATIPPNQIDANTITYPYRPARTIPLFNFAPLPAGIRVPYPPLIQPPAQQSTVPLVQQRSPCTPQQPCPPCGSTPTPSPSPCTTPAPPPCTTPAPSPPSSCKPTPPPPCTTPAPKPPCTTTPAPPPPCTTTPAPPPPCTTTPAPPPPCTTTPAPPPPCTTTPAPPPPCTTTPPPCTTPSPSPPPCKNPPPPPPPAEAPKKGSILLEYDDPVRIKIFSNDKKYLPASGSIYSGRDDGNKDWHSHFYPDNEKNKKKDEDFEEMEEEHIEEEEDEEPGQLKHYEEEDERVLANEEEEEQEDESETNLSIVKKPADQDIQRTHTRQMISTKTKTSLITDKDNKNEKENKKYEKSEKLQKMKKPKRKKWIRIVKKQRRKTKTDSNPDSHYQIDSFPEASQVAPKYYGKRASKYDSYEKDDSAFDDSASYSTEDVTQIDLKKIIVNKNPPELLKEARQYEFNFNPFALEPEDQRRKKLEKAVERYVEDYVEKQLGDELIKNTGVPKTTVFEFAPKNGPKIQTITTTVAKHTGNPTNFKPLSKPEARSYYKAPTGNTHILKKNNYEENLKKRGDYSYEAYHAKK